ncbi:MAG: hypothetical protein ACK55Z_32885 [bacterium]
MLQQTSTLAEHMTAADQSQQAIYRWTNQVPDAAADQPTRRTCDGC